MARGEKTGTAILSVRGPTCPHADTRDAQDGETCKKKGGTREPENQREFPEE